jgi:hypothetical protein
MSKPKVVSTYDYDLGLHTELESPSSVQPEWPQSLPHFSTEFLNHLSFQELLLTERRLGLAIAQRRSKEALIKRLAGKEADGALHEWETAEGER